MATDKPTVHLSLSSLRKEVVRPDEFKISLSGSKIISFPDLMAMESEASDELLERIDSQSGNTWAVLDDWLSEADAKSLRAEKLTRAELLHVLKTASKYYQDAYGDLGKDAASAS